MSQLRVRAAVKRRLVDLANHAFTDTPFQAQLTTYHAKDPDHVLYVGIETLGVTDSEATDDSSGTDRVTVACRIESFGWRGTTDAADAEAAVEEAFNQFEVIVRESKSLKYDAVPHETRPDGKAAFQGVAGVRITDVNGPGHFRPPDGKPVFGVLEFNVQFYSHLS